jgi:hypothetical protein
VGRLAFPADLPGAMPVDAGLARPLLRARAGSGERRNVQTTVETTAEQATAAVDPAAAGTAATQKMVAFVVPLVALVLLVGFVVLGRWLRRRERARTEFR